MAERLRRWTRNPMGFPRAGSNPAHSVFFFEGRWFNYPDLHIKVSLSNMLNPKLLLISSYFCVDGGKLLSSCWCFFDIFGQILNVDVLCFSFVHLRAFPLCMHIFGHVHRQCVCILYSCVSDCVRPCVCATECYHVTR